MKSNRKPTEKEIRLIKHLIGNHSICLSEHWESELLVSDMDDGGMGSLVLYPQLNSENREFGKQVSEYQFLDKDNVLVIATLYVDKQNCLYELDIWKVDYSPLLSLPDI